MSISSADYQKLSADDKYSILKNYYRELLLKYSAGSGISFSVWISLLSECLNVCLGFFCLFLATTLSCFFFLSFYPDLQNFSVVLQNSFKCVNLVSMTRFSTENDQLFRQNLLLRRLRMT